MNKNSMWALVAIQNILILFGWVFLAIVFNKWWIALFAVLFITSLKTTYKNYRVCDGCGKHSPYADSYSEALEKAKEAGWVHCVDGNRDYCPECIKKGIKL